MSKPHIHAGWIHAWADGKEVEWTWLDTWLPLDHPQFPGWWCDGLRFRLKPQPKPDIGIVAHVDLFKGQVVYLRRDDYYPANVRFIFDADTEKLKTVELIK